MRTDSLCYGSSTRWYGCFELGHCAYRHCALLLFRHWSIIILDTNVDTSQSPQNKSSNLLIHNGREPLFFVSWFGHILAWRFRLCCAISSVSECVFCKIFLCVWLSFCAEWIWWAASLSVRCHGWPGRETGCAFLYGVIAIGVVYQEMFSRFGGSLSLPQL